MLHDSFLRFPSTFRAYLRINFRFVRTIYDTSVRSRESEKGEHLLPVRIVRFYRETLTLFSMVIAETAGRYSIDEFKFKFKHTLRPASEVTSFIS